MKILHLLPLIPLSTAYVIPSEEVLEDLNINKISNEKIHFTQKENIQNALDDTLDSFSTAKPKVGTDSRIDSWINRLKDYALDSLEDEDTDEQGYTKDDEDIIDSNLPFPLPHLPFSKHHHHDGNSDKTIYQLISSSKYTTNLTKIIDEDESLVHLLNNTNHNFTLFAPTDHAFAKLPPHLPELSKEFIRAVLHYHLAAGVYSALDVFHHQTLPTLLNETTSGHELPQRVTVRPGLKGLKVNFYGRLVAVDIAASNGLIHGIDSILLPPPPALSLFTIVPTQFSTLTLGLLKTGLAATLEDADKRVTIFAPSNRAFEHLGLHINAFLFSHHGTKYLRALLQYHIVQNRTLYSDVFYAPDGQVRELGTKGYTHLDLPTLLGENGRPGLAVDVSRFGAYTSIKLNGSRKVAFADALARDGVVHILDHVLVPPCKHKGHVAGEDEGENELTVEDLKDRLSDWVVDDVPNDVWDHDGEL
ncbi:fasciclin domain-containing protein [Aspergillus chevalieri]|uniref:FAS1 domain-containing protein n=1 Tax=Aspergillus chevalieri TaxID=182096 RepID=A0A7R7ZMV0_ASPCH|nr:uncharacterized protein ACHE_30569S [Aspergillus chevalieri]BCR86582.1 hypothetical protein ACHE_30569S [Aspergillus chevalieri]